MVIDGTWEKKTVQRKFLSLEGILTCDAFTFLVDGVMWRTRCVYGATQLLRFLIGCGLYEFNG